MDVFGRLAALGYGLNLSERRDDDWGLHPMAMFSRVCANGALEIIEKYQITMKPYIITTMVAAVAVTLLAPQRASAAEETAPTMAQPDVVAAASSVPELTTLVTAIKAANLVSALEARGPFTVFAPTNEAFKKLPAGTLEDLLKPENRAKLAAILKGHVIKGRVQAADVKVGKVKTLEGNEVEIEVRNGKVTFGGATVVATDMLAANGVIHEIDAVVLAD
jgi:uncharacterized surface protein with fasciclin (FAS1) repeats